MKKLSRHSLPEQLNGCLSFSDDLLGNPEELFRVLRSRPDVWDKLRTEADLDTGTGRPREAGEWTLAFLAFLVSGHRDMNRWHRVTRTSMWKSAGFGGRPGYDRVYYNFCRLEEKADAFREAAAMLIADAVKHSGGRVGRDVHVDGTEAETHARLIHDCDAGCCPRNPDWKGSRVARSTAAAAKASAAQARECRHDESELELGELKEAVVEQRGHRRKMANGCWYRTADQEAGIRMYGSPGKGGAKRFWHGYYHHKAVDHYTGGVLATSVTSASVNESKSYDQLLAETIEHTGDTPRSIVADRGYSLPSVFERNTKLGIATVAPYRKKRGEKHRYDHDRFDRHGIPYCAHCGGTSRFIRFSHKDGPRLWFECLMPRGKDCERTQSINCNEEWCYLVPLWRNTEAYQALRHSHQNYERRHHDWRDRYLVAGDTHHNRPKRRGMGCQTLRSNAAMLVEWIGICWREGWLGKEPRRNSEVPQPNAAKHILRSFMRGRRNAGLHMGKHHADGHAAEIEHFREHGRKKAAEPPPNSN